MAFRSFKKDIEKIYQRIDKIAKVGRDNYQEYYNYFDGLITKSKYGLLTQVLYIKYNFDYTKYPTSNIVKQRSWTHILTHTTSNLQDDKYTLFKNNDVYQLGLDLYRERPLPSIRMYNTIGSGSELKLVVSNDSNRGVIRVDVLSPGRNYSTASYALVSGGSPSATVGAYIRSGQIIKVDVLGSGSNHGGDTKLGTIEERDFYIESIDPLSYTSDLYQQITDNKVTYLYVDKVGSTMSASFSTWNFDYTYDKNLLNIYQDVINYLI